LRPPIQSAPPFSAIGSDTDGEGQAQTGGQGVKGYPWRFCEHCQTPLGRIASNGSNVKRFCSTACRMKAAVIAAGITCAVCGGPTKTPQNRTCSLDCKQVWQRGRGGFYSEEQHHEIHRLWGAGYSMAAIGRQLGVSKNAISGYAHRHALPRRSNQIRPGTQLDPKRPAVPTATKPGRPVLICQPAGADRRAPGRFCSAHPDIRWHPASYRCRSGVTA
jgi:hypothetical protein